MKICLEDAQSRPYECTAVGGSSDICTTCNTTAPFFQYGDICLESKITNCATQVDGLCTACDSLFGLGTPATTCEACNAPSVVRSDNNICQVPEFPSCETGAENLSVTNADCTTCVNAFTKTPGTQKCIADAKIVTDCSAYDSSDECTTCTGSKVTETNAGGNATD